MPQKTFIKKNLLRKTIIILFSLIITASLEYAQNSKTVQINFDYTKREGFASNQIAVWVEDANGNYIKTIYITDFTGRRAGWKQRSQSLSNWQKKANAVIMNQSEIDSVSKATPRQGNVNIIWDCKDSGGRIVRDGVYRIVTEATIYQDNNVLYTAEINIGNRANSQTAVPQYSKAGAKDMDIIKNVKVSFNP